jgi:hypothetical protein
VPPATELTSGGGLDLFRVIGLDAPEVLGSIGVLRGWEMPGVLDEMAEGLVFAVSRRMSEEGCGGAGEVEGAVELGRTCDAVMLSLAEERKRKARRLEEMIIFDG